MPEYRVQTTNYYCKKVNSNIEVICNYLVHRNSASGKVDAEVPTLIECNKCSECGVEETSGLSASYNWNKCINPQIRNAMNLR